ncbi:uncharacterized protein LMH87_007946 [Akanthomyces muscarius]|uniref:Uncharacterized protein n=1 Tax=Akanthomyces muscarius TaxID=2231603 RepID=A0A9W8QJ83_AKAMU|nr:uncharacterized protein LMH87_007946 [Akanthomyces muscarius]KAJ4160011.1 hypothetical protein LMH87_007946 [Akanthomyces muscarius]
MQTQECPPRKPWPGEDLASVGFPEQVCKSATTSTVETAHYARSADATVPSNTWRDTEARDIKIAKQNTRGLTQYSGIEFSESPQDQQDRASLSYELPWMQSGADGPKALAARLGRHQSPRLQLFCMSCRYAFLYASDLSSCQAKSIASVYNA